jgi:hypothetical protein
MWTDGATGLAVDRSGNVVVTGSSIGIWADFATIQYSNSGVPLWTNRYRALPAGDNKATAVAVDDGGNVVVTGYSQTSSTTYNCVAIKYSSAGVPLWTNSSYQGGYSPGAVVVDGDGNAIVAGGNYLTIKYSSSGASLWTNFYYGPGHDGTAYALAVDTNGNVFVTGQSHGYNWYDSATIAYSSSGVPLWTNCYNGSGANSDYTIAIATDKSGNVLVAGESWDGSSWNAVTIKYSAAGVALWTNLYNVPGWQSGASARAVAVDDSGNVFVTGSLRTYEWPYVTSDYATIKYSSSGLPLWTNRYNGPGDSNDYACAVALDRAGNVFVTGSSAGSGSFYDYATVAYSSSGVPLWTNRYNGPANTNDTAIAVAVDSNGNVFVTGQSFGTDGLYDYATIKYSIPRPIPLAIQLLENQLVLSWTNAAFHLQCAPSVTGPFTNMPAAASPCTNPITGRQQFYRLMVN